MTPAQCRAARGLIGWRAVDLAAAAGLTRAAVSQFETGQFNRPRVATIESLRAPLERAGVTFIDNKGVTL